MEFFKLKPVLPVDRKTFLASTFKCFLIQCLFIFVTLVFMQSDYRNHEFSYYVLVLLFIFFSVNMFFFTTKYSGRFKDIYPNHELKVFFQFFVFVFPLIHLPFIVFLCLKESTAGKQPLKMCYKFSSFVIIAIPLLAIQFISPRISYWVAIPSNYYIVNVIYDSQEIIKLKDKFINSDISPVSHYIQNNVKLNTTEMVLLTAVSATNVIKKKRRDIASEENKKIENGIKYGVMLLKETNLMLTASEKSQLSFFDYSIIHWLSPTGPIEIALQTVIEMKILQKFYVLMVETNLSGLKSIEKDLKRLPASIKPSFQSDVLKVRNDLTGSEAYKFYTRSK